MESKTNRTIKVWTSTYHQLRVLAGLTGQTMFATLDRLVMHEQERIAREQRHKGTIPMDQQAQFRGAVRTVLTLLLDETVSHAERVHRATDILLALPVPMPASVVRSQPAEQDDALYLAGPDGLPSTQRYIPDAAEGPLSEEEVAIMLHAQREG